MRFLSFAGRRFADRTVAGLRIACISAQITRHLY